MGAGASCSDAANVNSTTNTDSNNAEAGDNNSSANENVLPGATFQTLADINADAFQLGETNETQQKLLDTLFAGDKENSYTLNGTKENLTLFLSEIKNGYINAKFEGAFKSYHTFAHALDVMLTCHCMLETGLGKNMLKPEERASLILAAIAHDVLHPGLSNPYFINSKHELAAKYNNQSILEQQSIDFTLPRCEKYELFSTKEMSEFIRVPILYTDMSKHKEIMEKMEELHGSFMEKLNTLREEKGLEKLADIGYTKKDEEAGIEMSDVLSIGDRRLFAALILHSADVSNPVKQFDYCERWAGCV